MIIYNVTINIEDEVHNEWVDWMKTSHIPDVMKTGSFLKYKICKVLSTQEDETGHTYAIQYTATNMNRIDEYREKYAPKLQQEHTNRFEGKFVAFRTLLEVI